MKHPFQLGLLEALGLVATGQSERWGSMYAAEKLPTLGANSPTSNIPRARDAPVLPPPYAGEGVYLGLE